MTKKNSCLFIHDHKVILSDGMVFSRGGLTPRVIQGYAAAFGEVSICSRVIEGDASTLNPLGDSSIRHSEFPDLLGKDFLKLIGAVNVIKKASSEADFLIVRLPSISGVLALFLNRKRRGSIIIEVVGCPFDSLWFNGSLKGKILAPIMWLLVKVCVRYGRNVAYVTERFLQTRYPTRAANTLGASDVEIQVRPDVWHKHPSWPTSPVTGQLIFGMIGNYNSSFKGYDTAFEALSILKKKNIQFSLELVGGGESSQLLALANMFDLSDRVVFRGVLSHPHEIFEWLDTVSIFLQPSMHEGLPRALVEAISRGCIPIATDVGGIPELVPKNLLITRKDHLALVGIVEMICTTSVDREIFEGLESRIGAFDLSVLERKRRDFYRRAIADLANSEKKI